MGRLGIFIHKDDEELSDRKVLASGLLENVIKLSFNLKCKHCKSVSSQAPV